MHSFITPCRKHARTASACDAAVNVARGKRHRTCPKEVGEHVTWQAVQTERPAHRMMIHDAYARWHHHSKVCVCVATSQQAAWCLWPTAQ